VLGHVDSGKTSACAALSDVLSTAALDKNPQSKQRGITLDLQFSAITLNDDETNTHLVFTMVDCPGHASLIRTIIGGSFFSLSLSCRPISWNVMLGSSIIDIVFMVIDATKGIQTQTAEGFVLAEMTTDTVVILLNKVDLLPVESREASIKTISTKLRKALEKTRIASKLEIIPFSARPGGGVGVGTNENAIGVEQVRSWLLRSAPRPIRTKVNAPFLFAVDHCFPIKGKGTVATGTVLRGRVETNSIVEIPHLHDKKKVKSIQMFKQPADSAQQGDRVGLLIPGLEATSMERGLICSPDSVHFKTRVLASFHFVPYFKFGIKTGSKFHVTIAHATVLCTITLLRANAQSEHSILAQFNHLHPESESGEIRVLLEFDQPTLIPTDSVFVASKLDSDAHANSCRLAFYGSILRFLDSDADLASLKAFKMKTKAGDLERVIDGSHAIGRNLFKKETDMNIFTNMRVEVTVSQPSDDSAEPVLVKSNEAYIEGAFGKSGKFKLASRSGEPFSGIPPGSTVKILLHLKRYFWTLSSSTHQKYVQ
jgi:selenocysteine-specific elongation factor